MQTRAVFDIRTFDIHAFVPSRRSGAGPVPHHAATPATRLRPETPPTPPPRPRDPRLPPSAPSPPVPTVSQRTLLAAIGGAGPQGVAVDDVAHACGNMPQVLARCVARGWALTAEDATGARGVRLADAGMAALVAATRV